MKVGVEMREFLHDVGNEQVLITAHTIIHRLHCEGGSYLQSSRGSLP